MTISFPGSLSLSAAFPLSESVLLHNDNWLKKKLWIKMDKSYLSQTRKKMEGMSFGKKEEKSGKWGVL